MQKNTAFLICIALALGGQLWGMNEELASMAGLIEQDDEILMRENKLKERQVRCDEIGKAIMSRKSLANGCDGDDYAQVKKYLRDHDQIPADQYGISLKDYVYTARMAVLLEKHGISLGGRTKSGSLLHQACRMSCTPMLLQYAVRRYCEEEELDINERRRQDGKTPLDVWTDDWLSWCHVARLPEARQKLQILCEAGADCTLPDRNGKTPLDLVEQERDVYIDLERYDGVKAHNALIDDLKQAMQTKQ